MMWQKDIYFEEDNYTSLQVFSFVIIVLGIISQSLPFAILGSIFFLFVYVNNYYLQHVGDKLVIENIRQIVKLFPNEQNKITLPFSQHSYMPIFNGKLIFTLGEIVKMDEEIAKPKKHFQVITVPFSILGKQAIDITIPFQALRRGTTKIKSLEIVIPHLFGFGEVRLFYRPQSLQEILVYPIPKTVTDVDKIVPRLQGDFPFRNSFYEDVTTIIGTREYNDSDPFNKIHWKASARTNSLQTKLNTKTTQFSWTILLDINHHDFEEIVSGITYFLESLTRKSVPFELYVNVETFGKKPYLYLPKGNGRDQLQKALEILARLNQYSLMAISFERMVGNLTRNELFAPFVMVCSDNGLTFRLIGQHTNYYSIQLMDHGMKMQKYQRTEGVTRNAK